MKEDTGAANSGANAPSFATEAGENPQETKPQSTSVPSAQSPPAENILKDGNETAASGISSAGKGAQESAKEERIPVQPGASFPASIAAPTSQAKHISSRPEELPTQPTSLLATSVSGATTNGFTTISPSFASQQQATLVPLLAAHMEQPICSSNGVAGAPLAGRSEMSLLTSAPPSSDAGLTATKAETANFPVPSVTPLGHTKARSGSSLRRGKWTMEEEAYVARVIQDFNSGFLNAPAGTTLRSYLSEKLQCDPMRITKKFTGDSCIGKRVFHPAVRSPSNAAAIDKAQAELDSLERRWRRRLEMQQRESAKKAAASAAAAAASASGRSHGFITQSTMNVYNDPGQAPRSNVVTQTASWLDRASTILKETGDQTGVSVPCTNQKFSLTQEQAQALESLPKNEIEKQMKEVERLIHEGPLIQQTSAGLPLVLQPSAPAPDSSPQSTVVMGSAGTASPPSDGQQTPPEPADKRMRTGAEDAEALVGFLTAVRASAAAGTDAFSG